MLSIILYVIAS